MKKQYAGFSYAELLIATLLITIILIPALEAMQSGILGNLIGHQVEFLLVGGSRFGNHDYCHDADDQHYNCDFKQAKCRLQLPSYNMGIHTGQY